MNDYGGLGLMKYYNAIVRFEMAIRRGICAVVGHWPVRRAIGDFDGGTCRRCAREAATP